MADKPIFYEHGRILQLVASDGWWAVYWQEDGTYIRQAVAAFALIEEWQSPRVNTHEPPAYAERNMRGMTFSDGYFDHDGGTSTNLLGYFRADEWDEGEILRACATVAANEAAAKAKL